MTQLSITLSNILVLWHAAKGKDVRAALTKACPRNKINISTVCLFIGLAHCWETCGSERLEPRCVVREVCLRFEITGQKQRQIDYFIYFICWWLIIVDTGSVMAPWVGGGLGWQSWWREPIMWGEWGGGGQAKWGGGGQWCPKWGGGRHPRGDWAKVRVAGPVVVVGVMAWLFDMSYWCWCWKEQR